MTRRLPGGLALAIPLVVASPAEAPHPMPPIESLAVAISGEAKDPDVSM
jgi:hypothetical protein